MRSALPPVDAAVVVCEADERKVPQLNWCCASSRTQGPALLFINKIDKADKRVRETLALLQPASRVPLVLRQIRSGRTASWSALSTSRSNAPHLSRARRERGRRPRRRERRAQEGCPFQHAREACRPR